MKPRSRKAIGIPGRFGIDHKVAHIKLGAQIRRLIWRQVEIGARDQRHAPNQRYVTAKNQRLSRADLFAVRFGPHHSTGLRPKIALLQGHQRAV